MNNKDKEHNQDLWPSWPFPRSDGHFSVAHEQYVNRWDAILQRDLEDEETDKPKEDDTGVK
jgi:hypothetical protein